MTYSREIVKGTSLVRSRGSSPALDLVLDEVVETAGAATTGADALRHLASLGGRRSPSVGIGGLPGFERLVADAVLDDGEWLVCRDLDPSDGRLALGLRPDGRPVLGGVDVPAGDRATSIAITGPRLAATVRRCASVARQRALAEDAEAAAEVEAWGDAGRRAAIDLVEDALLHTAPVLLHVRDATFTNFGAAPNLCGKELSWASPRSALSRLRDDPRGADSEQRILLVALRYLVACGGPAWIEEMNGQQLDVGAARRLAQHRLATYERLSGDAAGVHATPELVEALSAARSAAIRGADDRGTLRFRQIEGISFRKAEQWTSCEPASATAVPTGAIAALAVTGASARTIGELDRALDADWVRRVTRIESDELLRCGAEQLLADLLRSVIDDTEADFAMSRGVRDVRTFAALEAAGCLAEVEGWDLDDYFCLVLPAERLLDTGVCTASSLVDGLAAIAGRMRFNSWHFLPPSTLGEIDPRRDHFYSPVVPDLAEWVDQRHQGHVEQHVRFSIRYPLAVRSWGSEHAGLADVRVCRRAAPFTATDLRVVRSYALVVQAVSSALLRNAEAIDADFVFSSFDRAWSERLVAAGRPSSALGSSLV